MPTPCRNKRGKFVACSKKKKGSRKRKEKESRSSRTKKAKESRSRTRKSKESRSRTKKGKVSRRKTAGKMSTSKKMTPQSYYRKVVRHVPTAPMAPSFQAKGILRPGYYGRVSHPPPAAKAPGAPENLCWTNRNKESCNKRLPCAWDDASGNCVSRRKGGRIAASRLGMPAGKLPLSVCGTASTQPACDSVYGCRWSEKGNVCVPKKAEEYHVYQGRRVSDILAGQ